jgi:hypothetical protein
MSELRKVICDSNASFYYLLDDHDKILYCKPKKTEQWGDWAEWRVYKDSRIVPVTDSIMNVPFEVVEVIDKNTFITENFEYLL